MIIDNLHSEKTLLNQIKVINDSYERVKALTGENYNIFKLLGVESSELLHSKIVGDFLNSKGSHKQGSIFLELFIQTLKNVFNIDIDENGNEEIEFLKKFNCSKSSLRIEESIGKKEKNDGTNGGGRIDIILRDENKNAIIIENKIYAIEQENQVERYDQFGKGKTKDYLIFYLTLNGDEPTSIDNENKDKVICISYEKHIITWLELCKKEVVNLPIIRESISQYINLLKKLTNQTENQKQAMEIQNLILKNIESANKINQNYDDAISNFANKVKEISTDILQKHLINYHNENWKILSDNNKFGTIWINPTNEENKYGFGIEHFKTGLKNHFHSGALFYGIKKSKNDVKYPQTNNNFWFSWKKLEYEGVEINFSNPVDLLKIELNKEKIAKVVTDKFIEFFEKHHETIFNEQFPTS